jgi:hypothetical protein
MTNFEVAPRRQGAQRPSGRRIAPTPLDVLARSCDSAAPEPQARAVRGAWAAGTLDVLGTD